MMVSDGPIVILRRIQYQAHPQVWLRERKRGIGGSDAPAALGMSPWASPLSLYVDKRTPLITEEETEAMRWGRVFERPIAEELAKEYGLSIKAPPGLLARRDKPWQQCTVDFMVRGEDVPVEVKTSSAFLAHEWPKNGTPPDHVVIQVQHQLMVGEWDYGYVAAVIGGNSPRWCRINRNEDLIRWIDSTEEIIWDCIMSGRPPEPIGHDADLPALALIYAGVEGKERHADDYLGKLWAGRRRAIEMMARGKRDKAVLDAKILHAMGDAVICLDEDGERIFTVVHVDEGDIFDQAGFGVEHPALVAAYRKPRRAFAYVRPTESRRRGRATA